MIEPRQVGKGVALLRHVSGLHVELEAALVGGPRLARSARPAQHVAEVDPHPALEHARPHGAQPLERLLLQPARLAPTARRRFLGAETGERVSLQEGIGGGAGQAQGALVVADAALRFAQPLPHAAARQVRLGERGRRQGHLDGRLQRLVEQGGAQRGRPAREEQRIEHQRCANCALRGAAGARLLGHGTAMDGDQVVLLGGEPGHGLRVGTVCSHRLRRRHTQVVGGVPCLGRGRGRGVEPLGGVLVHALVEGEARAPVRARRHQQERVIAERLEQVEARRRRLRRRRDHRLGRCQVEAAAEDGAGGQRNALRLAQRLPAGVDGGAQRGVPGERGRARRRQQLEAPRQAVEDGARSEEAHARGRELDGQRQSVEPPHQIRDGARLARARPAADGAGALAEQGHRIAVLRQLLRRQRERGYVEDRLLRHAEATARGDDQRCLRRRAGPRRQQLDRGGVQLRRVVHHHHRAPAGGEGTAQRLGRVRRRRRADLGVEIAAHRPQQPGHVAGGGQIAEPGRPLDPGLAGELPRQARLAYAGWPEQRDQPRLPRDLAEALEVGHAPHEAGPLRRERQLPLAQFHGGRSLASTARPVNVRVAQPSLRTGRASAPAARGRAR